MNADFYIARAIPGMEQSWDERLGAIIFSLAGKWFWRSVMTTFVMLGRLSGESMKEVRPQRTMEALALIKKYGGELKSGYVMLGKYDLRRGRHREQLWL